MTTSSTVVSESCKRCGATVYRVIRHGGWADISIGKRRVSQQYGTAVWFSDTDPGVEYRGVHRCG